VPADWTACWPKKTGPVLVAEDPLTCVVRGCIALERMDRLTIFTTE
jgi:hypothetical protein